MSNQNPRTRIALVLDRSGSMGDDPANPNRRQETIDGYNNQIREIRANANSQEIFVNLFTFNHDVFEHLINQPADKLEEATLESYQPDGWTAWYDGMSHAIDTLIEQGADDPDCAFLVIVISDGQNNRSKYATAASLNSKIAECKATGRWTFTFMGCDETYIKEVAKSVGLDMGNVALWSNKNAGDTRNANIKMRVATSGYFQERRKGFMSVDNYMNKNSRDYGDFTEKVTAAEIAAVNLSDSVLSTPLSSADVFSHGNKVEVRSNGG